MRRAWRVRIIGSACTGEACVASRVFVETIIDAQDEHIIAVKTSPIPSDFAMPSQ